MGSRTGGTRDYKPQYMVLSGTAAAGADDYAVDSFVMPIVRPENGRNTATIMEILKVQYIFGLEEQVDPNMQQMVYLAAVPLRARSDAATTATLVADLQDLRVFAPTGFTAITTTSGSLLKKYPYEVDLTDNNGNGMLYASQNMVLHMASIGNTATTNTCIARILYRFVRVGMTEYFGLLQQNFGS